MAMADAAANAECAELLNRAGTYLLGRAAYSEARPLLERALAIREKLLGGRHPGIPKIAGSATWTRPKQKSCLSARSSPMPVNISHRHRAEVNMEPIVYLHGCPWLPKRRSGFRPRQQTQSTNVRKRSP
jgi:hypothetical protein